MASNSSRLIAAALVSPLSILIVTPTVTSILELAHHTPLNIRGDFSFAILATLFAYPAMLIFGVPAYFVLRHWNLASIWSAAAIGFLVAALIPVLIFLVSGLDAARNGLPTTIAYGNLQTLISSPSLLFGPFDLLALWSVSRFGL